MTLQPIHLCQDGYRSLNGIRELYDCLGMLPTSINADTVLIRSHVAYWSGHRAAESAKIAPSRVHSYRVQAMGLNAIARLLTISTTAKG